MIEEEIARLEETESEDEVKKRLQGLGVLD
jgi:hypothetical protein